MSRPSRSRFLPLLPVLAAFLATDAPAQTLSVEADRPVYLVGDVITLTVTGDSAGLSTVAIGGSLTYSAALTRTVQATQTQHTTSGQGWTLGPLSLRDGRATVFSQICCFSPQPVDQLQIATLKLIAEAPGDVTVSFASDLTFFGLTSAPGTSFTILPNPTIPPPIPSIPPSPGPSAPFAGGPSGSLSSYLIWPETAELGDTVGVLLDAPDAVDFSADTGPVEVDPASFVVHLTHMSGPDTFTESLEPRLAIEAPASLASRLVGQNGGSWTGVVLLFDLPALWTRSSLTFGSDELLVGVAYEGQLLFDGKPVRIMGNGGAPLSPGQFEALGALEQRPMLRFRPSWDAANARGFDPAWDVRAVQFVLRYLEPETGADVANLAPAANGDATGALTFLEPLAAPEGEKAWRVSLAAPDGFAIEDKGCAGSGDCYAGRWSLVDLTLDKTAGPGNATDPVIFAANDFAVEDVVVLDARGLQLNPSFSGDTFLRIHAVNNRVESALPPPSPVPVIAWPRRAYLGDTVAVLFNSESDTETDPDAAHLNASPANVDVHVDDPDGHRWTAFAPAAVVELPAALASEKVGSPPVSQTGVIAFFQLPKPWPNSTPGYSLPADFDVTVEYEGTATSGSASIEVQGPGGSGADFGSVANLGDLTKDRTLRLRPVWNESASPEEGFDPGWEIGAVEFGLRYTQAGAGEVTGLAALGNGEAIAGLAMVNALPSLGSDKLWSVRLIAPEGFGLPDADPGSTGVSPIGRWALLDLLVDAEDNGEALDEVFSAAEFGIEDVKVFGPDGTRLNPAHQGESFFDVTAFFPEPTGPWPLAVGLGVTWCLGWRRRRRAANPRAARTRGRRSGP